MNLDPPTVYVISGIASLLLGVAQLSAWKAGRFGSWSACWGLGNMGFGLAAIGLMLRKQLPAYVSISVSNDLALVGQLLVLQAVRLFVGRAPRWRVVAAVAVVLSVPLLLSFESADFPFRVGYGAGTRACCSTWIAVECILLARRERLYTAWVMAATFAGSVPLCLGRVAFAWTGGLGTNSTGAGGGLAHWLFIGLGTIILLQALTLTEVATEQLQRRIVASARTDGLTGALNRDGLAHARAGLQGWLVLVMIDMDHFKALNDRMGHAKGDAALSLLVGVARAMLPANALIVRLGGDEFVLIFRDTATEHALHATEQVRRRFDDAVRSIAEAPPFPTLSMGVAAASVPAHAFDVLLRRADEALYAAKQSGRNRTHVGTVVAGSPSCAPEHVGGMPRLANMRSTTPASS